MAVVTITAYSINHDNTNSKAPMTKAFIQKPLVMLSSILWLAALSRQDLVSDLYMTLARHHDGFHPHVVTLCRPGRPGTVTHKKM